jgi:hypothetical protein
LFPKSYQFESHKSQKKKITIKITMIKIKGEPKKKNQSNKMIQKQNQRERVSKLK